MTQPDQPDWLGWVARLQAIAQAGLELSEGVYDRERYLALRALATEIAAAHLELGSPAERMALDELLAGDGSAVVVHAGPDNFANIPNRYQAGGTPGPDAETRATGDSGARVACGVLEELSATEVYAVNVPPPRGETQKVEDDGSGAGKIVEFLAEKRLV